MHGDYLRKIRKEKAINDFSTACGVSVHRVWLLCFHDLTFNMYVKSPLSKHVWSLCACLRHFTPSSLTFAFVWPSLCHPRYLLPFHCAALLFNQATWVDRPFIFLNCLKDLTEGRLVLNKLSSTSLVRTPCCNDTNHSSFVLWCALGFGFSRDDLSFAPCPAWLKVCWHCLPPHTCSATTTTRQGVQEQVHSWKRPSRKGQTMLCWWILLEVGKPGDLTAIAAGLWALSLHADCRTWHQLPADEFLFSL